MESIKINIDGHCGYAKIKLGSGQSTLREVGAKMERRGRHGKMCVVAWPIVLHDEESVELFCLRLESKFLS